jgi:Protein of unknown function (DUF1579)
MKTRDAVAVLMFCLSLGLGAIALGQSGPQPAASPNYDPIRMQGGTWDAVITFFDDAGKPSGTAKGVQTNVLLSNRHWIINDLNVTGATPFQGHGMWGWDPVARQYVDTWVDTHDGAVRTDYGFWNAEEHTMYWNALQPDGNGHMVGARITEKYDGSHRTLEFCGVALQSGRVYKEVRMVFTKRP